MDNQEPYRRWTDLPLLPDDLIVSILLRLGVIQILEKAQIVCKTWYRICKDPMMWRTIDMCGIRVLDDNWQKNANKMEAMCRHAVDLGGDKVVNISLENFGSDSLLQYITKGSKRIKRLRLMFPNITHNVLLEVAPKLTFLEDLELSYSAYTSEDLEAIGRHCPRLKSLKLNRLHFFQFSLDADRISNMHAHQHYQVFARKWSPEGLHADGDAFAIAGTMHGLKQLQIFGNRVTNKGLQAILDGCPCLESLDLRRCGNLKVEGDLKRRCSQGIKQLRLPDDSTTEYEIVAADKIVYKLYQSFFWEDRNRSIYFRRKFSKRLAQRTAYPTEALLKPSARTALF